MKATLILEDGQSFEGIAHGAKGHAFGEIVFNTSMTGYQEIITDPSYSGQLVTFTHPHIGNYGVCRADMESDSAKAAGIIVRQMSECPSSHRSESSLPVWLEEQGVVAISDIDTRALTRHIRDKGVMMAVIVHGDVVEAEWLAKIREQPDYGSIDFVREASVSAPCKVHLDELDHGTQIRLEDGAFEEGDQPHIAVLDFGVKHSILRHLTRRNLAVTLVPSDTSLGALQSLNVDGVLVSNGPGDPAMLDDRLPALVQIAEAYPTWGICLGHQLLARAFGATTFKLPFGHRGPNQPVQTLDDGRVHMTSQNHGYAVDPESLPEALVVTEINLNDDTVEGFKHRSLDVRAVQYHPEAGPGPHDAEGFFDAFAERVRG